MAVIAVLVKIGLLPAGKPAVFLFRKKISVVHETHVMCLYKKINVETYHMRLL
ncbi:MAG: hypothetical protein JWR38_2753 [Mucilaginibacter sp.]|nr:hypothetical protein [Mucilaginibacter sp.]